MERGSYPVETVVRIRKTGRFAIIKQVCYVKDGKGFLHYLGVIEGKGEALYAIYHENVDLESLPPG